MVSEVATRRDLRRFIGLPHRMHAGHPTFVPPLLVAERERLDPAKNPFFEHARVQLFLARDGGRVAGRIAAIDDDRHNRIHRDNLAFFGFFEATSEAVALALFEAVERWARSRGRDAVRGPAEPSLNDGAGFQIDAFDTLPYLLTPWNPPSYPRYAEAAGYRKIKDLQAWRRKVAAGVGDRLRNLAERVRERREGSYSIRSVDLGRFDEELAILKRIYDAAWEDNWGQVPYTEAEFARLGAELRHVVDPELAMFLEVDGEAVATLVAIPDLNQVLHRFDGRLLPFGVVHLLNRRRIITRMRMALLGVLPAWRRRGLDLLLVEELGRRVTRTRMAECEMSWILEDNHRVIAALRAGGAVHYKTYRLYEKAL